MLELMKITGAKPCDWTLSLPRAGGGTLVMVRDEQTEAAAFLSVDHQQIPT
ncbi:hypothetical protein YC2023_024176 [Brassica napus]